MVLLAEKRKLLWVGAGAMPGNVRAALGEQWDVTACPSPGSMARLLGSTELVILSLPEHWFEGRQLSEILTQVERSGAVVILLVPSHLADHDLLAHRRGQFVVADLDIPPGELAARLDTAAALGGAIRRLRADVASVRSFTGSAAASLQQLDEEMRLAARLQQDFLPRTLPQVGRVRFATLFRPAGWVSGDIYDVFRLDEQHIGFYVADVVGHGMPAALLTMFIKKALQTKRIAGHTYQLVWPHEALAQLNADICQQNFTSCQFCTAFYGIINAQTLRLQYARGGHPCPIVLSGQAPPRYLDAQGSLLGVFPGERFQPQEIQLASGQRVVVFSDGAEEVFSPCSNSPSPQALVAELLRAGDLPPEEMVLQLTARIDDRRAGMSRNDDITLLVMDIA